MYYIQKKKFIHPHATIIGSVSIDNYTSIWPNAVLRGDVGYIKIGKYVSIQDNVICHMSRKLSNLHLYNNITIGHGTILHGCTIKNNCLIGMGAILLDNCIIGEYSLVGAGTLISANKSFPDFSLIYGTPGKFIRKITMIEFNMLKKIAKQYAQYAHSYISR